MANAFFITETYLKDNSPLSGNVDIAEIYPFVREVENSYIQEAIGTRLFNDLITKLNVDSTLATYPDDLTLMRKIRDVVLWYTIYDALPFLAIKIRNIGIVKQTGEGHESASREDVSYLRKYCKDKGDFYLKVVQDYLCYYHTLYPTYKLGTKNDMIPNTTAPQPNCDIAFDRNESESSAFYRKWGGLKH